jgi:hypothetical protein
VAVRTQKGPMSRLGQGKRVATAIVIWALLVGSGLTANVLAQTGPDPSEVVIVLDFSASILKDSANRNRFGAALERIADRVDEISSDLVAGDATVTIVQFATRAADQPGCADLKLLGSPATVATFATCLRSVASAYRKGLNPALTKRIGVDTNYVAALDQAAKHLPADAVRPAVILFTDGKHDVKGVPVSRVPTELERLFGTRSPFALLPVGMGLDPKERGPLEAGLLGLRIIRDMPACVSGTAFDWPTVVFESADEAGNAVAVALQDATCTFTVEASPTPSSTPAPTPGDVQAIRITARDGVVELTWAPPAATSVPILDYRIRCRAGDEDWIESKEGVSLEPTATFDGLTNGTAYTCEVAAVSAASEGSWVAAPSTATPMGLPAAPGKPSVAPMNHALQISIAPDNAAQVSGYHYECSGDNGGTWPAGVDVTSAANTTAQIGNLTNGVDYVCRAFAENATGLSAASPLSDSVKPCGSGLECNSSLPWILGVLGFLAAGGVLAALVALYRDRSRGYVVAVVDVIHTANLGHGSRLGISFVRPPGSRTATDIVADRGSKADFRIRHHRGGRFEVIDRVGRHVTMSGEPVIAVDSVGVKHEVVLRAFATNSASPVSTRR